MVKIEYVVATGNVNHQTEDEIKNYNELMCFKTVNDIKTVSNIKQNSTLDTRFSKQQERNLHLSYFHVFPLHPLFLPLPILFL